MARLDDLAEELLVQIFKDLNQACSEDHEYSRIVYKECGDAFSRFLTMPPLSPKPSVKGYEAILKYAKVSPRWQRTVLELDKESLLEELTKLKDRQNSGYGYNMNNFIKLRTDLKGSRSAVWIWSRNKEYEELV